MMQPKRTKDGFYEIDGRRLISVTTALDIIDTGIGEWKAKVGTKEAGKISRTATTIGKQVHRLPEADVKGVDPKLPKKPSQALLNCKRAYERWKEERNEKLLSAEEFVYSLKDGYAGTCDAFGWDAAYDFKTSKRISPLYWLQLAAYAKAKNQMAMDKGEAARIKRLVIVRLDKDSGDYYQEEREYSVDLFYTFAACLRLWRYYNLTEKEEEDDEYNRARAGRELEPDRSGNSDKGTEQAMDRPEDSHDRSGEIWEI